MKRLRKLTKSIAAALAVARSFDTAWTSRTRRVTSQVDPSLSAGEVSLVHILGGRAGALSLVRVAVKVRN